MARIEIFAKQMARKLRDEEMSQVSGGGSVQSYRPVTCGADGNVDWQEDGMDFRAN
jgi:hypothetical protein